VHRGHSKSVMLTCNWKLLAALAGDCMGAPQLSSGLSSDCKRRFLAKNMDSWYFQVNWEENLWFVANSGVTIRLLEHENCIPIKWHIQRVSSATTSDCSPRVYKQNWAISSKFKVGSPHIIQFVTGRHFLDLPCFLGCACWKEILLKAELSRRFSVMDSII